MRALRDAVERTLEDEALSVGRDGASDAISFLEAGIPAVEFGPIGGGHHGPEEWVSLASLPRYREALADFVRTLPAWLAARPQRRARRRAACDRGRPRMSYQPPDDSRDEFPRRARAGTWLALPAGRGAA